MSGGELEAPMAGVSCPVSGQSGRPVAEVTLRSLVRAEHGAKIGGREWFFCDHPGCIVVYYARDGRTLGKEALKVRVGLKERAAPRPVCYCFGHTVESIGEEIARTGRSTVAASIKQKVEARDCHCEVLNPKGTCCLGDVNRTVKEAFKFFEGKRVKFSKAGLSLTGALVAGFAASACCLGPLVLGILGLGGTASALVFGPYRPYLLVLTAVFLGFAFYVTYRRPASACGPGQACEMPNANRVGRVLLWLVTLVVVLGAAFPSYSRYLF